MNLVRMMGRKANTAAIAAELAEIEARIAEIQQQSFIVGYRLKVVCPAGTAGKPSQQKGYARLIDVATGKSRAIAPDAVGEYQRQIEAGREIARLERRRGRLLERLDKATTQQPAPVVDIPIGDLNITTKKRVILRSLGIHTTAELIAQWPIEHRGLGEQGTAEIVEALQAVGLAVV